MRMPRPSSLGMLLALACLLVMQGWATWLLIDGQRTRALEDAGRTVTRVLAGVEANVNRAFLQMDALMSGLELLVPIPDPADRAAVDRAGRALRALSEQSFFARELSVVSADGRILASGREATRRRPPDLPDSLLPGHEGYRQGALMVSNPVRNPLTGEWALHLGRGVRGPQGAPAVVVAELPVRNLAQLALPDVTIPGLQVTLERDDGRLLMSNPHDALRIGQRITPVAERLALNGVWSITSDPLGGGAAVAAATRTLYDGLVVGVHMDEGDALAGWRRARETMLAVSMALALVVLAVTLAGALYVRARNRAAAEVALSKRVLEQALDSMSDGFVLYDSDFNLVVANRRYSDLFPHLRDLIVPGVPFLRIAERAAATVLPDGTEEERRAWIRWRLDIHKKEGSFEQVLPIGVVVQSTQAETPDGGLVSVHRDITRAKQAEARLAEAKEAAERAHRMKSEFLSNMSHELRTPLNAIIGFAQVLERGGDPTAEALRAEYARDIRVSGEHLLAIINDVLDMSKLEAGAMTPHETECDLGRLVIGASGILREQARSAGITLRMEPPDHPLLIRADERLIRQVVLNLVSNAVKFTNPGGSVTVSVTRDEAGEARIAVTDTGIGVAPEHLSKVFNPFYQADGTASRRRGGTGLGLPISLAIMKLHQGRLEIASEPDRGTRVVATLPAGRCLSHGGRTAQPQNQPTA